MNIEHESNALVLLLMLFLIILYETQKNLLKLFKNLHTKILFPDAQWNLRLFFYSGNKLQIPK
jgi:hypothetical protein